VNGGFVRTASQHVNRRVEHYLSDQGVLGTPSKHMELLTGDRAEHLKLGSFDRGCSDQGAS
jgi:hypothetical protein